MPIRVCFGPSASLPCSCDVITGKVYRLWLIIINLLFRKSPGQAHWARANGPMRILVAKASAFSQFGLKYIIHAFLHYTESEIYVVAEAVYL